MPGEFEDDPRRAKSARREFALKVGTIQTELICTHTGSSMRRCHAILIVSVTIVPALVLFALSWFPAASAQSQPDNANTRSTQPAPSAVPKSTPLLDCQGCHGPGKTLPYLGGALFHGTVHTDYELGFHAKAIQNGSKAATCLDCHTKNGNMTNLLSASNPESTIHRSNISETCGKCHGDKSVMQGSGISDRPFLSYRESVHASAVALGNTNAAICTDCHRSHDIRPASDPQSTISKINIPSTCGHCHRDEATQFLDSVHGRALARGVSRSPTCTDCHGIHNIKHPTDQTTAVADSAVATESCAKCHEGVALTQEFGVAEGRVTSYKDSYHGLASRFGSRIVANCASCHGVHNILPSSDQRSMIHATNLTRTCGQCHLGAGTNFTAGKIHLNVPATADVARTEDLGTIGTTWVRRIYLPLIVLTIGGMVLHNFLIWRKKALAKRRENRTVERLSRKQRVQHWLLLTSFIALVLSGFALQYPNSWLAWTLGGSEYLRRGIHRVAAVVMLAVGAYHLAYLALAQEGRNWVRDMFPRVKDIRDLLQNFGYYLGLRKTRPKMARFGYPEKAEYWAVVWGTIIMGITGLMIWFKLGWFRVLPRWAIDVALAIHFYEAVLATLAIVVWHFYHVIFDPDVYPINWAFYDGQVSEELFREEHELAYEQMKEGKQGDPPQDSDDSEAPQGSQADQPV